MAEQSGALVCCGELAFDTLDAAKEWILSKPRSEQYGLQTELMDWILEHRDRVEEELVSVFEWVSQDDTYEQWGITEEDHKDRMNDARQAVEEIKARTAKENAANVKRAKDKCSGERGMVLKRQIDLWDASDEYGKTFYALLATIFQKAPNLQEAIECINSHIWNRIMEPKRGQAKDARIKPMDLRKTLEKLRDPQYSTEWLVLNEAELVKHQMTYGATGLLEPLVANEDPRSVPTFDDEPPRPVYTMEENLGAPDPAAEAEEHDDGMELDPEEESQQPQTPIQTAQAALDVLTLQGHGSARSSPAAEQPEEVLESTESSELSVLEESDGEEMDVEEVQPETPKPSKKKKKRKSTTQDESHAGQWKRLKADPKSVCSCPVFLVEQHWPQFGRITPEKEFTMFNIKEMLAPLLDQNDDAKKICLHHLSLLATVWDLLECDSAEDYTARLVRILEILGDSEDLGVAVRHFETRKYFGVAARDAGSARTSMEPTESMWNFSPAELVTPESLKAIRDAATRVEDDLGDLSWIYESITGVKLAEIFLMELEMYLHHFKVPLLKDGFLPVYYSLAQQLVRQDPRLHLIHVRASDDQKIEMMAVPTPLRFRTPENSKYGIQYLGLSRMLRTGRMRVPRDDILIARGKPMEVERFQPSSSALQTWILNQTITLDFISLREWGVDHFMNEFFEPLHNELDESNLRTSEVEPGQAVISLDGQFVNFPSDARENQMIVSTGLLPLNDSGKGLINGMTVAEVRGWHLDREVPAKALYEGLWDNDSAVEFPVSIALGGLGTLSDTLVGRGSWKNGGLEAFTEFWEGDGLYEDWKVNAVESVWATWWDLVDLEKKTFGTNSFFLKGESVSKLDTLRKAQAAYK